jgi:hypothetical protein
MIDHIKEVIKTEWDCILKLQEGKPPMNTDYILGRRASTERLATNLFGPDWVKKNLDGSGEG